MRNNREKQFPSNKQAMQSATDMGKAAASLAQAIYSGYTSASFKGTVTLKGKKFGSHRDLR